MDEEVCPKCGDFVDALLTTTGWCSTCTYTVTASAPIIPCACGRNFRQDHPNRIKCPSCRRKQPKVGRYNNKYPGVTCEDTDRRLTKPWRARLRIKGKHIQTRYFATEQEAVDAMREMRKSTLMATTEPVAREVAEVADV